MITLENVNKYFNHHKKNEIHVINNTTISFPETGLVALLGPSGCGKTTLLNTIGGLDKINKGKIYVNNKKITSKSSKKVDKIRNLNIGYIFQNYNLIDDKTVYDNVAISLKMIGIKDKEEIKTRVNYVLDTLGIYRYRNRLAGMLSGGERQRVGIARAIVKNPNVILADEPTGNLDSANTIETMNIIKSISKNRLVILVTHETDIAKFYADRIIELEDGIIKKDYQNKHDNNLDYRIDNKIYLKDFKYDYNYKDDNNNIKLYSNSKNDIKLTIVVKNNNIYIKGPVNSKLEVIDDNSNIEFINDHYKQIDKSVYEKYEFDFENRINNNLKPKYSSIINPINLFTNAFAKIRDYSFIKKLLLFGFLISGFFIFYCISNIFGITSVEDKDFVEVNKNYYSISTGKLSTEKYNEVESLDSVAYVLPGDSMVTFKMEINYFYQLNNAYLSISGSLSDINTITKDNLVYGRMPENDYEIVIDKMALKDVYSFGKEAGLLNYEDYLNKTISLKNMNDFTIVGITDDENPVIYTSKNMFIDILNNKYTSDDDMYDFSYGDESETSNAIVNYNLFNDITITKGRLPENDYEVVVYKNNEDNYELNKEINIKVNGNKLVVVGYYDSSITKEMLVNENTIKYNVITNSTNMSVMPRNNSLESDINNLGMDVVSTYDKVLSSYNESRKESVKKTVIVSLIFLVISFIEIYLIIRASFLTRIKEVGIYRAIGVKKGDIYKMFYGEIIAITTLASLPGVIFAYYVLKVLSTVSYFDNYYMTNIFTLVFSIIVVYLFNIIIGLLPVFRVLINKPAEILARKDLD